MGNNTDHRPTVLVVEDDVDVRETLVELLSRHFQILTAADGQEGVAQAQSKQPDLILMDLKMPKMDGITACQAIRSDLSTRHIPVMILTAVDDLEQKVKVFDMGADDFILKPFHPKEVVARILSKLRRVHESEAESEERVLTCGNLTLDLDKVEARIGKALIELSVLEFGLLKFLVKSRGKVQSRAQILKAVWASTVVSERTVDSHVATLRKKLKGFDHSFTSIYGAGYALKPMLDQSSGSSGTGEGSTDSEDDPTLSSSPPFACK